MKNKVFYNKIEEIVEKENPCGILLVGSLGRMNELDFKSATDVDIFVIVDSPEFERQVVDIEGMEFDISYLPIELLDYAIEKRLSSIICVLAKSKILYKSEKNTLKNYLKMIKSIYEEGPQVLEKIDEEYERFRLTKSYLILESRKNESLNFKFLSGVFVKELITSYFRLNNMWMSPDKRMLMSIEDKELRALLENYFSCNGLDNIEDELCILKKMIDYVLQPFGGRLNYWEKGRFPFDFL